MGRSSKVPQKHAPDVIYARKPIIYLGIRRRNRKLRIQEYIDHAKTTPEQENNPRHIASFGNNKILTTIPNNTRKNKTLIPQNNAEKQTNT